MARKDGSFNAHIDIIFFYHKRPFSKVNFDFSEKSLLKCFIEFKNTLVFTT